MTRQLLYHYLFLIILNQQYQGDDDSYNQMFIEHTINPKRSRRCWIPAAFAATASWKTSVTNKISDGLSTPTDSLIST